MVIDSDTKSICMVNVMFSAKEERTVDPTDQAYDSHY